MKADPFFICWLVVVIALAVAHIRADLHTPPARRGEEKAGRPFNHKPKGTR